MLRQKIVHFVFIDGNPKGDPVVVKTDIGGPSEFKGVGLGSFRIQGVDFNVQPSVIFCFHCLGYAYSLLAGYSGGVAAVKNNQFSHSNLLIQLILFVQRIFTSSFRRFPIKDHHQNDHATILPATGVFLPYPLKKNIDNEGNNRQLCDKRK